MNWQAMSKKEKRAMRELWKMVCKRCRDSKAIAYPYYGARGIDICDEWHDSRWAFYRDVPDRPSTEYSLDRIDTTKGYQPGNVRWATRVEQMRNARSNRVIEFEGRKQCMAAWVEEFGLTKTRGNYLLRKNGYSIAALRQTLQAQAA